MSTTPTSAKLANLTGVADLIAASSTFQAEAGVSTSAAAREYIHIPYLRPRLDSKKLLQAPLLPLAILQPTKFEHYRMAGGGQTYTLPRGTIKLLLGRRIRDLEPEASEEELIQFTNWEEAVLNDVLNSAGLGDKPNLVGAEQVREPTYTDPTQEAGGQAAPPFYTIEYLLPWDAQ